MLCQRQIDPHILLSSTLTYFESFTIMTKRMLIMLGAVLLLIAGLGFGFYLNIQKLIASVPKPGPQTVSTIKAEMIEWQPQISAIGSLSPTRGVDVSSEIAGLVRTVNFRSGEEVQMGQLLIQLNADTDNASWRAASAAAELAEVVLKRDQAQLAAQAVSQAQVDNDLADLKSKKAIADQQLATLEKKSIRAPFAGKLGITTIIPGQYLNPGDKIVPIQNINSLYADFYLPEQKLSQISKGQTVNLTSDSYPGKTFVAHITAINPKVDTAMRNIQVQATLDNSNHLLLPGMFANVNVLIGAKKKYLTIPQTAITYNPYGSTVFIAKISEKADASGKKPLVAQQVFVTTGDTRGDQVAILKGIEPGQDVVTSGMIKLKNDTPLVIDNTVLPANSASPTPQEK
jgi:membrane fusion protein (multidrug efflux system)